MARLVDRQTLVDRQRDEIIVRYPSLWEKLIHDWKSPGSEDRAWLMYSANYLFRTHGVCWAIDPLALKSRLPSAPDANAAHQLKDLGFFLLTHRHKDHLDIDILRRRRHLPILWVVPETILSLVLEQAELLAKQILVSKLLQPIDLQGHRITPFNGLHRQYAHDSPNGCRGVPAMGY